MIDGGGELDAINAESAYWYALSKDSPGRRWFMAEPGHPAVARALGIGRTQDFSSFALAPFRLMRDDDDQWRVAAAWPTPRMIGPDIDMDWLGIASVIAWNPKSGAVEVLGDPVPQLVGRFDGYHAPNNTGAIYSNPRTFFQHWAANRARFAAFFIEATKSKWSARPSEPDLVPGALLIGDPRKVRWNLSVMPAHIECHGIDAAEVNRAVFMSARLPRFSNSQTMKVAA